MTPPEIKKLSDKLDSVIKLTQDNSEEIKDFRKALLGDEFNPNGIVQKINSFEEFKTETEAILSKRNTHIHILKTSWGVIALAASVASNIVMALVAIFKH